jgi:tRNA(His) guanylyltransferase
MCSIPHKCPMTELERSVTDICARLCSFSPVTIEGIDPSLHYLPPHIPKPLWTSLGDEIAKSENPTVPSVSGDKWVSLRLDGNGFSRHVKFLRREGILEPTRFSEKLAKTMSGCCLSLMEEFNGIYGYTQSDEMTILIPPANVTNGVQQDHPRNGRVTKITTLAAGMASSIFALSLAECCDAGQRSKLRSNPPRFDCRMGVFSSDIEALSMLLWRAHDCSVNGVSDAVYQVAGSGKEIQSKSTKEKIEWLWKQGLLPLPPHQAHGSIFYKTKVLVAGENPKTGETNPCLRRKTLKVDPHVSLLELFVRQDFFAKNDWRRKE